jgi:hypothetical protein
MNVHQSFQLIKDNGLRMGSGLPIIPTFSETTRFPVDRFRGALEAQSQALNLSEEKSE